MDEQNDKLNPRSPNFDKEAWKSEARRRGLREALKETAARILMADSQEQEQETLIALHDGFSKLAEFSETVQKCASFAGEFQRIGTQAVQNIIALAEYMQKHGDAIKAALDEMERLQPFLEEEFEKPEYKNLTIDDLLETTTDENGKTITLWEKGLEAARKNMQQLEISLPLMQSTGTPEYYTSPNTALANVLSGNDGNGEPFTAGEFDLPVANKGKKNETTVYTLATLENMEGITIEGKAWSEYDRAVHDAACSIYLDRSSHGLPPIATSDMIYRQMTGKTDGEFVSPQASEAVTKSIEKQRKNTHINADLTAEMLHRKIMVDGKPVEQAGLDDFILASRKIYVQAGGEKVEAYIFKEPILLTHARMTGQLITVKTAMLDIKKMQDGQVTAISLPNTESRIAIKSYLLRRVKQAEHDLREYVKKHYYYEKKVNSGKPATEPKKPNSNIILFDTLFECTGITSKDGKTDARKFVFQVLDYWQARNDIKGYEKRKKGRSVDAVIIDM